MKASLNPSSTTEKMREQNVSTGRSQNKFEESSENATDGAEVNNMNNELFSSQSATQARKQKQDSDIEKLFQLLDNVARCKCEYKRSSD